MSRGQRHQSTVDIMFHFKIPLLPVSGDRVESDMEEDDDDVEYYRQEVGEEPDPGICVHVVGIIFNLHISVNTEKFSYGEPLSTICR